MRRTGLECGRDTGTRRVTARSQLRLGDVSRTRGGPNFGRPGDEATLSGGLATGTCERGVRPVRALRASPARRGLTAPGRIGYRRGNVLPTLHSQILTQQRPRQGAVSLMTTSCGQVNQRLRDLPLQPPLRRAP